jgi:hypothetical protein
MEHMATRATLRGGAEPSRKLLDALSVAVFERLLQRHERRHGFISETIVKNIAEMLHALTPLTRAELPYSVRTYIMAACVGAGLQHTEVASALGMSRAAVSAAAGVRARFFDTGVISHSL